MHGVIHKSWERQPPKDQSRDTPLWRYAHASIDTCLHTCMHTSHYILTCIPTAFVFTYLLAFAYAHLPTYLHSYIYIDIQTLTGTYRHPSIHTFQPSYPHARSRQQVQNKHLHLHGDCLKVTHLCIPSGSLIIVHKI